MALHTALIELFSKPDFAARCGVIAREERFQSRKDRILKNFTVLIRAHRGVVLPQADRISGVGIVVGMCPFSPGILPAFATASL
jgi:hypothetical protein